MGGYESTAVELKNRIKALIPSHPELIDMDDCWGLFAVEGFHCTDLGPSMFQAGWALSAAQKEYRDERGI